MVFHSVSKMVVRSHQQLSGGLNTSADDEFTRAVQSSGVEGQKSKGILKSNTAGSSKEALDSIDKKTVSFPSNPVTTMDDKGQRRNSKPPSSPPPLCLVVSAHFSTPRIHLEPSLPAVHSYLSEIVSTMLAVLSQVTWWGAGGRRTLYNMFKANGTVESMQEDVLQAIQSKCRGLLGCSIFQPYTLWRIHTCILEALDKFGSHQELYPLDKDKKSWTHHLYPHGHIIHWELGPHNSRSHCRP